MSLKKAIGQAVRLYEDFRDKTPKKIGVVQIKLPKAAAVIGYLEAVDYRTTHNGKTELYQHSFEPGSRPLLAVSEDGKQLLLLGGRYQFTEQGIVDKDARGRLITNPKHGKVINPRKRAKAPKRRRKNPASTEIVRMQPADVSRVLQVVKREQAALRAGLKLPARSPRESTLLRQYVATYGLGGPLGAR